MILQELTITNFRSYYGDNTFSFDDGLNIIIGDNGDGKTTFFEALEWLFDSTREDKSLDNVSGMLIDELKIGESAQVGVSLSFEHYGQKTLTKSFYVYRTDTSVLTRDFSFKGTEEDGFERLVVKGKSLIDRCFDAFMQKYCLFKGENKLNIFNDSTALASLVSNFSDIRSFKTFVETSTTLEKLANKAQSAESKNDKKVSAEATRLESQINTLDGEIIDIKNDIAKQNEALSVYDKKIDDLEKYHKASEDYQELKKRLNIKNEQRNRIKRRIIINFNTNLLDKMWILCSFQDIQTIFQKKVSAYSKEKRSENEAYIAEQAKLKGKKEVIDEINSTILDGVTPLPWYLPDAQTMQEMIDDECCKVCGRKAPKGSDAYEFMLHKLQDYMANMQKVASKKIAEEAKDVPLFKNEYIEELQNLSITLAGNYAKKIYNLKTDISETIEFVEARKKELAQLDEEIKEIEEEKARLLIQSDGVSEEFLDKSFSDITGIFNQRHKTDSRIKELTSALKEKEKNRKILDQQFKDLNPGNYQAKLYKRVHTYFEIIMKAFIRSKDQHFTSFIMEIEDYANEYFKALNGDDFRGIIRLVRKADSDTADIKLFSKDRSTLIKKPNTAQETTMYMSVLFAIAKMTSQRREQRYPLIFDAPTSSFGDFKEDNFYSTIGSIAQGEVGDGQKQQCIIATKDLLVVDKATGQKKLDKEEIDTLGESVKIFRIEKAPGFDPLNLATIRTIIHEV